MALIEQITNQLNNPAPSFDDPEQDSYDVTQAQITYNKDDDEIVDSGASQLRRQAASFLSDTDRKYAGQKMSRKNLDWFDDNASESEGDKSESGTGSELKLESESGTEEDSEDSEEEEQQLDKFSSKVKQAAKKHEPENEFRFEDDGDYSKYADSLDEAEDDSSENTEDDQSMEEDHEDSGDECGKTRTSKDGQEDAVLQTTTTDQSDEIAKGRAAIAQLGVWDNLMEGRIKLQKILVLVNQLPQPDVWKRYITEGRDTVREAAEKAQSMLQELLAALLQMQGKLLLNKAAVGDAIDDGDIVCSSDESEAAALKRKRTNTDFDQICAKRHARFSTYRNDTLHKWHDKTRLFSKKLKSFSAFDIPVLKQIDQVLSDRDRLVRRTQIKRSSYHVVGKSKDAEKPEPSKLTNGSLDMQSTVVHDPEIFDDDDFYHQLLRDLIERKAEDTSDPTMVSRQWLEIQKLRNKAKRKNVDTRASKGRKLRYNVHNKLVNFMAPMDSSKWSTEAKNDLFASLFKDEAAPVER